MSNSTPQDHYLGLLAGDNVIRKPTRTARARVLRSIVAFILVVLVIVVSAGAWLPAIGDWLAMPATMDLHRADAIIIHGGNPIRSLYGVDLYRRGLAPELWHTGYAKGEKVLTAMIERGIPRWSFRYQLKSSEPAVPLGRFTS